MVPQQQPKYAQVAQSVEQGTENPRVGGSIPPLGTINISQLFSRNFSLACNTRLKALYSLK